MPTTWIRILHTFILEAKELATEFGYWNFDLNMMWVTRYLWIKVEQKANHLANGKLFGRPLEGMVVQV